METNGKASVVGLVITVVFLLIGASWLDSAKQVTVSKSFEEFDVKALALAEQLEQYDTVRSKDWGISGTIDDIVSIKVDGTIEMVVDSSAWTVSLYDCLFSKEDGTVLAGESFASQFEEYKGLGSTDNGLFLEHTFVVP